MFKEGNIFQEQEDSMKLERQEKFPFSLGHL